MKELSQYVVGIQVSMRMTLRTTTWASRTWTLWATEGEVECALLVAGCRVAWWWMTDHGVPQAVTTSARRDTRCTCAACLSLPLNKMSLMWVNFERSHLCTCICGCNYFDIILKQFVSITFTWLCILVSLWGTLILLCILKLTCFFFSVPDFSSLHLCSQSGWSLSMEGMVVEQERPMWTLPPTRKPWRPWRNTELTCVRLQSLQQPSYYPSLFNPHKDGERKNGYSEDSVFLLANPLWWGVVVGETVWKQWDYMQGRELVWLLMTIKSRILIFSALNDDKHDLRFCFWTNLILGVK